MSEFYVPNLKTALVDYLGKACPETKRSVFAKMKKTRLYAIYYAIRRKRV